MNRCFHDRIEAGRLLAKELERFAHRDDVIVLGLPRGGVPVAAEVAQHLHLPLDVFLVRKLGLPGYPELAMGAIASGGVRVMNRDVFDSLHVPRESFERVVTTEQAELERREKAYRNSRPAPAVAAKTVIIVDDGIATGSTMIAAIRALRELNAERIVVAIPVIPASTCADIEAAADELVVLVAAEAFAGVGGFYQDFSQTSDDEVRELLARATTSQRENQT